MEKLIFTSLIATISISTFAQGNSQKNKNKDQSSVSKKEKEHDDDDMRTRIKKIEMEDMRKETRKETKTEIITTINIQKIRNAKWEMHSEKIFRMLKM